MATRTDPQPIPLNRAKAVGDDVYWYGINGHRYEGVVQRVRDGEPPRVAFGDVDGSHSDDCGCWREPWEYDPVDAY